MGLKESCAVEGRVQRAMVKIVKETLQWSKHVLFKYGEYELYGNTKIFPENVPICYGANT